MKRWLSLGDRRLRLEERSARESVWERGESADGFFVAAGSSSVWPKGRERSSRASTDGNWPRPLFQDRLARPNVAKFGWNLRTSPSVRRTSPRGQC
ncbi:MAG: hypothetical protein ACTS4U_00725 [Candidatus Hodgkinia cicadicola]